ncbi:MAG: hypothetical protein ARM1_0218 [Candidatus Micrarchaeota archaeon]|nr:MAG: hypothetical protein ARM1_0218 [Candidatus Micrarchaeota archaeon]
MALVGNKLLCDSVVWSKYGELEFDSRWVSEFNGLCRVWNGLRLPPSGAYPEEGAEIKLDVV